MRLGGHLFQAETISELHELTEKLDCYGLSTITAPRGLADTNEDFCQEFCQEAERLNIVIGEAGFWQNLMTDDTELRNTRIETVRRLLKKGDLMGCRCVVTLVGSKDPSDAAAAPHPYMYTEACKQEFREIVLRILDGLDLKTTKYTIEPWHNSFFYRPDEIKTFLDMVDHPLFGLHLDQMNMVSHETFYDTTQLINTTFDLLADKVASVHLKDVRWNYHHMFLKWDEVTIGDGVLDYDTYLKRLDTFDADMPCFCEHIQTEELYALNFARLHYKAEKAGTAFIKRT
jgi:sugar phosphate isomerase/epimerase